MVFFHRFPVYLCSYALKYLIHQLILSWLYDVDYEGFWVFPQMSA
jgi:hypothetical protein